MARRRHVKKKAADTRDEGERGKEEGGRSGLGEVGDITARVRDEIRVL